MNEIVNASQIPRIFYARHMQPGICKYEKETVLFDTDCLQKSLASAIGKPVFVHHQKVDLEKIKEQAAGYITEAFYNELDGWGWFKFLAIDDECYKAIQQGWKVSNAYIPTHFAGSGTKNNCHYDREIVGAEFTHLAIVPVPRYEDADIFTPDAFKAYQENKRRQLDELTNSKPDTKGTITMFKLFKNERKEVTTVDADTMVEIENGKNMTVGEMLNAIKKNDADEAAAAAAKKKAEDEKENGDQMVDCDGEKMPLKELVNRYTKMNEKKNAEDADKKKAEDEKKNADEAEAKKKKDDEEKKNALATKNFDELQNAHNKTVEQTAIVETSTSKVARGKQRYGSGN